MRRQALVLAAAILTLVCGGILSSRSVSASHPRDVLPQDVDPHLFALPVGALPPPANACIFGTQGASGALTAAHVSQAGLDNAGAITCGLISAYLPATATAAGTVTVNGQIFAIAPGVAIAGIDPFTIVDHIGISNNQDADGAAASDGSTARIRIVHTKNYELLGRLDNGWREDMHYLLGGVPAGSEYLVSVFPDAAHAQAAMDDATDKKNFGILSFIAQLLPAPEQCTSGTSCKAYFGIVPGSSPAQEAIFTLFVRGPVLVETATQVPNAQFESVRANIEASLYSMLISADNHIQLAFNPQPATNTPVPTATVTPTPAVTDTPAATNTPTATPKPIKKTLKCKKGYKKVKVKGKQVCKKVKKK